MYLKFHPKSQEPMDERNKHGDISRYVIGYFESNVIVAATKINWFQRSKRIDMSNHLHFPIKFSSGWSEAKQL